MLPLLLVPVCANRFHRHYSGQSALLNRQYRGISNVLRVIIDTSITLLYITLLHVVDVSVVASCTHTRNDYPLRQSDADTDQHETKRLPARCGEARVINTSVKGHRPWQMNLRGATESSPLPSPYLRRCSSRPKNGTLNSIAHLG